MRKIKEWWKEYKHGVGIFLLMIAIIFVVIYDPIRDKVVATETTPIYMEKFELHRVPAGMIIWKHGVPETYKEFVHADSANRYEFYDVGILTKDTETIFCVRVPYYAIGLFQLGGLINIKNKSPNKRNPIPNLYVQQLINEKKTNNLTIL